MKQCPRCASEINKVDKVCPRCGLPVDKMNLDFSDEEDVKKVKLTSAQKKERKRQQKEAKKAEKKARKLRESRSDTDFSKFASNSGSSENTDAFGRRRNKKKSQALKFDLDENGEFNIDTADVEIVGEETGKIIDEVNKQTYSVKKARGDYREPKIKWWEIYKLADRSFARRKIKKEVVKASKIKPDFIKKSKLLLLALFFGWCGAHNFYAKNKKKGWVSVISLIVCVLIMILADKFAFFASIQLSIAGCAGFIFLAIWFSDLINIIFNNFRYRIQADEFIFNMNIKTRAKLGEKYIDIDLYQKPWWVRFKVWCQKKKRGYQEWKHDRRQRLIEKEKAKQAKADEQAKIDADIAEFEAKESAAIEKVKSEKIKKQQSQAEKMENVKSSLDANVLNEIKSFENESGKDDSSSNSKPKQSQKKAKVVVNTKKNKNNKK